MEHDGVFERVIRLDERTNEAHRRLDRHEQVFTEITGRIEGLEKVVNDLKVAVGQLNTKAAMAAGAGAIVGSAIVGVLVAMIQ